MKVRDYQGIIRSLPFFFCVHLEGHLFAWRFVVYDNRPEGGRMVLYMEQSLEDFTVAE